MPLFLFMEGETDCEIAGLALAFRARPALRLGIFPIVGAVADEMFDAADRAGPLSAAFLLIRLKFEGSRSAAALAQSGRVDLISFSISFSLVGDEIVGDVRRFRADLPLSGGIDRHSSFSS